jgi:diphthamide synthase (EF-2-diphthine--ammonia ligase)
MHGVRESVLDRQIAALELPALKVMLPNPCSDATYQERMAQTCARIKEQGVSHLVFGDLFLEDVRAYRERQLAASGMTGIFPLWRRDTAVLARTMIASGVVAHLVCVDPRRLGREFAGRQFDTRLLDELPAHVDPCGENGEFHTLVSAGPMFTAPIAVTIGAVVDRDGFAFADVTTTSASDQKCSVSVS